MFIDSNELIKQIKLYLDRSSLGETRTDIDIPIGALIGIIKDVEQKTKDEMKNDIDDEYNFRRGMI